MGVTLFLCENCGKNNTLEELKSCMADFCDMKCYNEYHKRKEKIRMRAVEEPEGRKEDWVKNLFGDMRDLTPDEEAAYEESILKTSKPFKGDINVKHKFNASRRKSGENKNERW